MKALHYFATIVELVLKLRTFTSPVANVIMTTVKSVAIKEFDETNY